MTLNIYIQRRENIYRITASCSPFLIFANDFFTQSTIDDFFFRYFSSAPVERRDNKNFRPHAVTPTCRRLWWMDLDFLNVSAGAAFFFFFFFFKLMNKILFSLLQIYTWKLASVVYDGELQLDQPHPSHYVWLLRALNPPGVSPLLLLILPPKWINGQW